MIKFPKIGLVGVCVAAAIAASGVAGLGDAVAATAKKTPAPPPQTPGSIAFDNSATAVPATLSANGQLPMDSYYKFKVTATDGKPFDKGAMLPLVARAWFWDQGRKDNKGGKDGSLTCLKDGAVMAFEKTGLTVPIKYTVTGFDDVIAGGAGGEITSATVRFTLGVGGGGNCTGSFYYARDTINRVTANFQLTVSDPKNSQFTAQAPIKVSFQAPTIVAPRFFYSVGSERALNRGSFESAIMSSTKTTAFGYRLAYRNGYGMAAPGTKIKCTLGSTEITLTTDSYGLVPFRGYVTVAMQPRTTTPPIPPAVWDVTTSLTGSTKVFTLTKGKPIGSVSCTSSDSTPAKYSQDIGNWP